MATLRAGGVVLNVPRLTRYPAWHWQCALTIRNTGVCLWIKLHIVPNAKPTSQYKTRSKVNTDLQPYRAEIRALMRPAINAHSCHRSGLNDRDFPSQGEGRGMSGFRRCHLPDLLSGMSDYSRLAPSYSAFNANWWSSSNLATVVEDSAFDEGLDDFPMVFIEEVFNV
jgi:hypothetical protein